ncbi:alpha-E domain-containing protein [Meridianimarinicoccus aquatilis]|uniref:Alpha-E domain-containing protein n=1 Tax=Meridianimarinicoccus aquatilis TaxID=2552766 RepID=A0A4R6B258_9RHOB|nr:alpha-E domain-containing protein [Fluviibacterium aquatile]QIE42353.1 alpha-E domain-containing protein [Rhodobacteraceae bacterium SC52]TDL91251.1 alpha-E domain-containing protein [Fluviibacterium aquatile]
MLSRTADNLYWMGRYMERAETMARLLHVGARMNLIPDTVDGFRSEWVSILQASGTFAAFDKKYGEPVERNLVSHLFFDRDNPSSVAACIATARENARIVRTALSAPVWDALNEAYQELKELERTPRSEISITALTEWTARHHALASGALESTLLRNDGYDFVHLGFDLERADNTARFLDVKYYVLLPDAGFVGSGLDNVQWQTLLRGMQMHRAFHWAYGGEVTAAKIADLLILNPACPRSLLTAVEEAVKHLDRLAKSYGKSSPAQSAAQKLLNELSQTQLDDIFDEGLHDFLDRFKGNVAEIGTQVSETYLIGAAA